MYNVKEVNFDVLKKIQEDTDIIQTVFTSYEWIKFLWKNGKGKPVILEITKDKKVIAYFVGVIFKKFGIKILGSPFEGWTTCDMGFCALDNINRLELLDYVKDYAFKKLKCLYMEVVDERISLEDLEGKNYNYLTERTYVLNINQTDEELFKIFKTDCRNYIRQFERRGAVIERVNPSIEFADEYYDQLIDVFKKQNLKPFYNRQKVYDLMQAFEDVPDELLCLRVCDPNGRCIATSIFPGLKNKCYFWGAASYTEYQHYRPNEYMVWVAIKFWRDHGASEFNMVGIRPYKKKFGPHEYEYPRLVFSKYRFLLTARGLAKKTIMVFRKLRGA